MIADNDAELCHLLKQYLGQEVMAIPTVSEPLSTVDVFKRQVFDLLKLDSNMSKLNGVDTLKMLRLSIDIAIKLSERGLLTEKEQQYYPISDVKDKISNNVVALYQPNDNVINVDNLTIVKTSRQVMVANEFLNLTSTEFNLLLLLIDGAGAMVRREELSLNGQLDIESRSIDVHISNLRKKLGLTSQGRKRIKTIRGIGYQYVIYPDT